MLKLSRRTQTVIFWFCLATVSALVVLSLTYSSRWMIGAVLIASGIGGLTSPPSDSGVDDILPPLGIVLILVGLGYLAYELIIV